MMLSRLNIQCILLFTAIAVGSFAQHLNSAGGFIENKGQIHDQNGLINTNVIACAQMNGFDVLLYRDGFSYQLKEMDQHVPSSSDDELIRSEIKFHRVDIRFEGMNNNGWIEWKGISNDYDNYVSADQSGTVAVYNVHRFQSIVYHNIYAGVDVEFLVSSNELQRNSVKYNFILNKGSDISKIKLRYSGLTERQAESGIAGLTHQLQTSLGVLTETVPLSYFKNGAELITANVGFQSGNDDLISFVFLDDKSESFLDLPLIIDPIPSVGWSTYFGGSSSDVGLATELDGMGSVYLAGNTSSTSGIATSGAHQGVYGGSPANDIFISKFDLNGNRLWSTYFGGSSEDQLYDLVCDGGGFFYLTGYSTSTSALATPGAYMTTNAGGSDAVLAKFNSNGVLQWCTYFGGGQNDIGRGVAVAGGAVCIVGQTSSTTGIATAGAHQGSYAGGTTDGFLAMFNTSGSLSWSTYFGGIANDGALGIAMTATSNIYFCGFTNSTSGIATVGAPQATAGGSNDAFVSCINTAGSIVWSTYLGGTGADNGYSIDIDPMNNVLLSGQSNSASGVATAGAYSTVRNGSSDGFIAVYDATGSKMWATYIGGNSQDNAYSAKFDGGGFIYVGGYTASTSGLATISAAQTSFGGGFSDAFLAQFSNVGVMQWITYLGGSGDEIGNSISIDNINGVFFGGSTNSTNNISTAGSHQPTIGGSASNDAFLIRYGNFMLLPITVTRFEAHPDYSNNSIICLWEIEEQNLCHNFSVERSVDGIEWTHVSDVGCLASTSGRYYSTEDMEPVRGLIFYRLKQYTLNGEFIGDKTTSVVYAIDINALLFPNPASQFINLMISPNDDEMIDVLIYDSYGKRVFGDRIALTSNSNALSFYIGDAKSGLYFLEIIHADGNVNVQSFFKE